MDGSLPSLAGVTCSHLYHAIPMMASGWFWIDPNGGDNADAVSVYCEVQTDNANTLVYALQNLAQDRHTGPSGTDQLSFISSYISGEFEYNISASQLQALQDQSSVGRQSLVFQCKGVLVHSWTSQSNTNDLVENFTFWKSSRGLLWYADGSNATALGSNYSDVQRYPVYYLDDGCKSNNIDIWSNTTVLFASNEPAAVPIVDVALLDAYSIKEEFGIDFGPAVFSTTSFKDLGLSQFKPGRSCLDILGTGNSRGDGVYWIDPLRNGDTVLVRCNMTAGGFTQIPREPTQKVPLSQWVTEGQDAYRWFSGVIARSSCRPSSRTSRTRSYRPRLDICTSSLRRACLHRYSFRIQACVYYEPGASASTHRNVNSRLSVSELSMQICRHLVFQ
eukprot:m.17373 g.17373  ORF g.17373 m.17373 type:complete len:390 (-) comp10665_c0_seq9:562-1731(-)